MGQSVVLDWALWYARRGWPVLPLWGIRDGRCLCGKPDCSSPGKHPHGRLAPTGVKIATTDEVTIASWFASNPDLNLGIATGEAAGLLVVDVDGPEGEETIARQRSLAPTPTVTTGRGRHHYCLHEPGHKSRSRILPGIDIRTDGGYVVAPPSQHVCGDRYVWGEGQGPHDLELVPAPSWITREPEGRRNGSRTAGLIREGARNETLASIAGKLRRSGADQDRLGQQLAEINRERCRPPLGEDEVARIATSVASYSAGPNADLQTVLAPILDLPPDASPPEIEEALRLISGALSGADGLRRQMATEELVRLLTDRGMSSPRHLVKAALSTATAQSSPSGPGRSLVFKDPEPAEEPVQGARLLQTLVELFERYLILPKGASTAIALWVMHTYVYDTKTHSPKLAVCSPEKRCAKTRLLTVLQEVVRRPLPASNITPAGVFRIIEQCAPSLLIDEADTFLDGKGELRGILNASHSKSGAYVVRVVGDDHEPRTFSVWAPAAIALIGSLPTTLEDRSVVISMRRKKRSEQVARMRYDVLHDETEILRRSAMRWAIDNMDRIREHDAERPEWLDDRACDNWEVLFTIADVAGGDWPQKARDAARIISGSRGQGDESQGVLLLSDMRDLFQREKSEKLPSAMIVPALNALEDRPWAEVNHGRGLKPQSLAKILKPFGIVPRSVRLPDGSTPKGYLLSGFEDAFGRYLSAQDAEAASPKQPPLPI